MSIRQTILPFKLESWSNALAATAHSGLPLVVELMRALFPRAYYRRLGKALGYRDWKVVRRHLESLVALVVAGGEHIDDLVRLRNDPGIENLLGFRFSSPTQAKDFLYRFHQRADGEPLSSEEDKALSMRGDATLREEGPGLRVLGDFVREATRRMQLKRGRKTATLDVDATIVEAHKERALKAYEGTIGYQPQMAYWAEGGVWVLDQFRDGNVPAHYRVREFLEAAFESLPEGIQQYRFRGDRALYNEEALTWADEKGIEFVVSVKMSGGLEEEAKRVGEGEWSRYKSWREMGGEESSEIREWAEVCYVPDWKRNRKKEGKAFRYLAIRVRPRQESLFEERGWRYFAVVTNMDWNGGRLLRYHREKQGTVEHGHGVMKNDLGAGVLPCGRFGANAAWWRVNVLVYNLLELLKAVGLPAELSESRPKRLRFVLFNIAGLVVRHANQVILRLKRGHDVFEMYEGARRALRLLGVHDTS